LKLAAIENYMRDAGLYDTTEIRPVNETPIRARWKLGQALAEIERKQGQRTSSTGLTKLLERLGQTAQTAMLAQRIGTLPETELTKALARSRELERGKVSGKGKMILTALKSLFATKATTPQTAMLAQRSSFRCP
jgi:hypothetical protein